MAPYEPYTDVHFVRRVLTGDLVFVRRERDRLLKLLQVSVALNLILGTVLLAWCLFS
jgi:hypothetical protein